MTCQRTSTGRSFSTSCIHREAIQAQGHLGSNQKSTGVRTVSATVTSKSVRTCCQCTQPAYAPEHSNLRVC